MTPLAHHGAIEAIALFVPALAIVGVIAGAVLLDRRRGAEQDGVADQGAGAGLGTVPDGEYAGDDRVRHRPGVHEAVDEQ
jgi:hypothetical protein